MACGSWWRIPLERGSWAYLDKVTVHDTPEDNAVTERLRICRELKTFRLMRTQFPLKVIRQQAHQFPPSLCFAQHAFILRKPHSPFLPLYRYCYLLAPASPSHVEQIKESVLRLPKEDRVGLTEFRREGSGGEDSTGGER